MWVTVNPTKPHASGLEQRHLQAAKSWSCWNSPGDSLSQWSVILSMTSQHVASSAQGRHHLKIKIKIKIYFTLQSSYHIPDPVRVKKVTWCPAKYNTGIWFCLNYFVSDCGFRFAVGWESKCRKEQILLEVNITLSLWNCRHVLF